MKRRYQHILLIASVLPQFALADLTVNHQSLGTVQAVVDFCAQVKPADAARFEEQAELLVSGLSKEELSKVRAADDYKKAYASTNEALDKVDAGEAAKACAGYLQADK